MHRDIVFESYYHKYFVWKKMGTCHKLGPWQLQSASELTLAFFVLQCHFVILSDFIHRVQSQISKNLIMTISIALNLPGKRRS